MDRRSPIDSQASNAAGRPTEGRFGNDKIENYHDIPLPTTNKDGKQSTRRYTFGFYSGLDPVKPLKASRSDARWSRWSTRTAPRMAKRGTVEDVWMNRTREDRLMLWIDAVGGFWICLGDQVTIGQPTRGDAVDIPILGDLSSHHARIVRHGESYLIEPIRETSVRGRKIEKPEPLFDGATIRLGSHLELLFRRPHPLSMTARLDITSRHQTQPSADAILLMADTCLLGPDANCHVGCPNWEEQVVLFRRDEALFCKTSGKLALDGKSTHSPAPIETGVQISGSSFSFFLEPL